MKRAGLERTATAVAARLSARHWSVSSRDGLARGEPSGNRSGRHFRSVDVTKLTYFDVNASDLFAADEIERARRYHRPLYLALGADLALQLAVLAAIAFGPPGDWLWDSTSGPWWARTLELTALVLGVGALVRLPLSAWRGWAYERRWGFSTQSLRAWLVDVVKGLVLGAALTGLGLVALVGAARAWPGWWPLVAAPGAALLTLVLSLFAPLFFERLFNRFWPLPDEELARDLRGLSERAGVPVRTMLVSDASRRTRKHNAYVSGLGPTRRLVLYDTLLEDAPTGELRGVVAHELGHRRFRHVAAGTLLGMAGVGGGGADPLGAALLVVAPLGGRGLGAWRPACRAARPARPLAARARRAALRDVDLAPLGAHRRPLRARADR